MAMYAGIVTVCWAVLETEQQRSQISNQYSEAESPLKLLWGVGETFKISNHYSEVIEVAVGALGEKFKV
ncbi:hypothetical protein NC652_038880 [Populus alba x Populus x berolinensis]|nr:hypothetical protein NC652_038880 [Populus alba x Populus x berolinensis]